MPLSAYRETFPKLAKRVFVHDSAQVIGDVALGDDCSVWCNAVLRGDVNAIVVGQGSNIQDLVMCHVSHKTPEKPGGSPLVIGSFVTVGHSAILHGCTIGDDCLIGMGSIVMDDAIVENQVLLGAGSLVPPGKTLESGYLYLRYSAEHYIRVKNHYLEPPPPGAALRQT